MSLFFVKENMKIHGQVKMEQREGEAVGSSTGLLVVSHALVRKVAGSLKYAAPRGITLSRESRSRTREVRKKAEIGKAVKRNGREEAKE